MPRLGLGLGNQGPGWDLGWETKTPAGTRTPMPKLGN